ncbi:MULTISPECIES: DUF2634 domain-containing protein [unclassified Dehalobacter]|uniref:DUF2634 domain-containing protein n=1 Tax=unclassified Dehalobacter TaxID=2635733 RepID=UPI001045F667|nr:MULTISPECIES: DUF2634 domain-containing protein [unclassified Dehalobacter]TCX51920.1 hypothetical protein C1I36_06275 [Dehalobacter sp. 14DCB1]TCX52980.1 hypothetical protein C1I38_07955 [Dehalobacter sp. 12DCB1]
MGLDIPINLDLIDSSAEAIPTKTPYIDWAAGRIYGYVDSLNAMKQHVKKTLLTERFKFLIYDNQYGAEIEHLIMDNIDMEVLQLEAVRVVKDALLCDKRIIDVYDFDFSDLQDERVIRFSVDTIYGPIQGEVPL